MCVSVYTRAFVRERTHVRVFYACMCVCDGVCVYSGVCVCERECLCVLFGGHFVVFQHAYHTEATLPQKGATLPMEGGGG